MGRGLVERGYSDRVGFAGGAYIAPSAMCAIHGAHAKRTHATGRHVCATHRVLLLIHDCGNHGESFKERFNGNGEDSIRVGLAAPGIP